MLVVIDTNMVVSGLLSVTSPPGQVVEGLYAGDLTPLYDDRILAEYADVLARPKFPLERDDVERFLAMVRYGVSVAAPPLPLTLPDISNLKFIEVAVAGGADAIVTGNARDFRLTEGRLDLQIVSPRRLIDLMRTE